jgi:septal ring factor EnvC (AmiA/AmiB activator)
MTNAVRLLAAALAGAALCALLGWLFILRPLATSNRSASERADKLSALYIGANESIAASERITDQLGIQVANANRANTDLRSQLARSAETNRQLRDIIGGGAVIAGEIGSGLDGDIQLARTAQGQIRQALAIAGSLPR